jgi:hypothetical protein
LSWQFLKIGKVSAGSSLSIGTSPTTEIKTPLNPEIFAAIGHGVEPRTSCATKALVMIKLSLIDISLARFVSRKK